MITSAPTCLSGDDSMCYQHTNQNQFFVAADLSSWYISLPSNVAMTSGICSIVVILRCFYTHSLSNRTHIIDLFQHLYFLRFLYAIRSAARIMSTVQQFVEIR